MKSMNLLGTRLFLFTLLLLMGMGQAFAAQPAFKRVIWVVLENTDYDEALAQPFFKKLTEQGILFSNMHAETHPSQPNYIAMIAGSTLGVRGDGNVDLDGSHLGDLLEQKGLTWKAYAEDYPGGCFLGKTSERYARKHVPFLSFTNVQKNPARCANIVNAKDFERDFSNGTLANFSMYIPNLDNDGHDTSPAYSNKWLQKTFGAKLSDASFMKDTLFVVTYDESESYLSDNQIFTVAVGANAVPGSKYSLKANHYSLLKTVEDVFGLGSLNRNDAAAQVPAGVWR